MKTITNQETQGNWEVRIIKEVSPLNDGTTKTTYRVTRLHTEKLDHYGDFVSREFTRFDTAMKNYQKQLGRG